MTARRASSTTPSSTLDIKALMRRLGAVGEDDRLTLDSGVFFYLNHLLAIEGFDGEGRQHLPPRILTVYEGPWLSTVEKVLIEQCLAETKSDMARTTLALATPAARGQHENSRL